MLDSFVARCGLPKRDNYSGEEVRPKGDTLLNEGGGRSPLLLSFMLEVETERRLRRVF
jgi:hypothetical protein